MSAGDWIVTAPCGSILRLNAGFSACANQTARVSADGMRHSGLGAGAAARTASMAWRRFRVTVASSTSGVAQWASRNVYLDSVPSGVAHQLPVAANGAARSSSAEG